MTHTWNDSIVEDCFLQLQQLVILADIRLDMSYQ